MPLVQIKKVDGTLGDRMRWGVPFLQNARPGDSFVLSIDSDDKNLLRYIDAVQETECCLDKRQDGGVSICLMFEVKQVSHILDTAQEKHTVETICIISPKNRNVDQIVTYLFDRGRCDPNVVQKIRGI